uniref:Peroxygenase 4 n=3 Tax=Zea mays TaxID=4577 RepID=A0A804LQL5_MAIZE
MRYDICRRLSRLAQPCAVASMLSYLSRVAGGCVPPQHRQQSLLPLIDDRVVCATTELARMAGCWAVLLPSALLVWIVCCNWVLIMSVDAGSPYGANMTDLMRHVQFFDEDRDGLLTIPESTKGFIAIGLTPAFALSLATATHAAFGPLTTPPGKLPSINIYVSHIHGAVHPSDSGAIDKKGNFVPKKFERIFQKFSHSEEDALSWLEIEAMLVANRDFLRPLSWPEAETEWQLIHMLGKDRHGYLHKDTLRGVYDGTVFPKMRDHTIDPHARHSDA